MPRRCRTRVRTPLRATVRSVRHVLARRHDGIPHTHALGVRLRRAPPEATRERGRGRRAPRASPSGRVLPETHRVRPPSCPMRAPRARGRGRRSATAVVTGAWSHLDFGNASARSAESPSDGHHDRGLPGATTRRRRRTAGLCALPRVASRGTARPCRSQDRPRATLRVRLPTGGLPWRRAQQQRPSNRRRERTRAAIASVAAAAES